MNLATPERIRSLQRKLYCKAKAVAACLTMKPVGKPDAGNPHVRFDERGRETGRCRTAQATAPFLDSTNGRKNGQQPSGAQLRHAVLPVPSGTCGTSISGLRARRAAKSITAVICKCASPVKASGPPPHIPYPTDALFWLFRLR